MKRISDRSNARNTSESGPKSYRKGGAVEIDWHADEEKEKESVIPLKKSRNHYLIAMKRVLGACVLTRNVITNYYSLNMNL